MKVPPIPQILEWETFRNSRESARSLSASSRISLHSPEDGRISFEYLEWNIKEPMGRLAFFTMLPSSKTTTSVLPPPISTMSPESASMSWVAATKPNSASSSPLMTCSGIPALFRISSTASRLLPAFLRAAVVKAETLPMRKLSRKERNSFSIPTVLSIPSCCMTPSFR